MPYLRNPDEIRKTPQGDVPYWKCPHCGDLKSVDDFGWRYPEKGFIRQSWCTDCRREERGLPRIDPNQTSLL